MGPKDVGPKAGWLRPGAHKTATLCLIAATTFICSNLLELPWSRMQRLVETHAGCVCLFDKWELPPVTCTAEQWSRIGVYPAFMTRLESLIGAVSPSMSGHLQHQHSLPLLTFVPLSETKTKKQGILCFLPCFEFLSLI